MYEQKTNSRYQTLSILEKIFATIAIASVVYVLFASIFAGPFFFLIFIAYLFSIPGIIGLVALLLWAVIKSIRMSKQDRSAFFSFRITLQQGVVIVLLAIIIILFAAFMLL